MAAKISNPVRLALKELERRKKFLAQNCNGNNKAR
jgi:hypothetical protein